MDYKFYETFLELEEIVELIKESKICDTITVFGSSLHEDSPHDYDVNLYIDDEFMPEMFLGLIDLMIYIEEKYVDVSCSYGPREGRKKGAKYNLSLFFTDSLSLEEDRLVYIDIMKNHVVLSGEDPFLDISKPSKRYYASRMREFFRPGKEPYQTLKVLLRQSLQYLDVSCEKKDLISNFENSLGYDLPNNLKRMLEDPNYTDGSAVEELEKLYRFILKKFDMEEALVEYSEKFQLRDEIYTYVKDLWTSNDLERLRGLIVKYQKLTEEVIKKEE